MEIFLCGTAIGILLWGSYPGKWPGNRRILGMPPGSVKKAPRPFEKRLLETGKPRETPCAAGLGGKVRREPCDW